MHTVSCTVQLHGIILGAGVDIGHEWICDKHNIKNAIHVEKKIGNHSGYNIIARAIYTLDNSNSHTC